MRLSVSIATASGGSLRSGRFSIGDDDDIHELTETPEGFPKIVVGDCVVEIPNEELGTHPVLSFWPRHSQIRSNALGASAFSDAPSC